MFGALKRGRFRRLASLTLVVNVVGELQQKRTLAAQRGFLAAARLSCVSLSVNISKTVADTAKILMTNRKSHMGFPMTPRSMTLDDFELLQGQILAEFHVISRLWEPTAAK